jgi:hypothetical protein
LSRCGIILIDIILQLQTRGFENGARAMWDRVKGMGLANFTMRLSCGKYMHPVPVNVNQFVDQFLPLTEAIDRRFRLNYGKVPVRQRQLHEPLETPHTLVILKEQIHEKRAKSSIDRLLLDPFENRKRVRTYLGYCPQGYGMRLVFATDFKKGDVAGLYHGTNPLMECHSLVKII